MYIYTYICGFHDLFSNSSRVLRVLKLSLHLLQLRPQPGQRLVVLHGKLSLSELSAVFLAHTTHLVWVVPASSPLFVCSACEHHRGGAPAHTQSHRRQDRQCGQHPPPARDKRTVDPPTLWSVGRRTPQIGRAQHGSAWAR